MSRRLLFGVVTVAFLLQDRHIRYVLFRRELFLLSLALLLCYYYVRSILQALGSRLRGCNLVTHDLSHHLHFRPPTFIGVGFSDLQLDGWFYATLVSRTSDILLVYFDQSKSSAAQ